jgi:hypothetical protein
MIADGVYLNLDPETYRLDLALGSTDHKEILAGAVQWHAKRRNAAICELLELGEVRDPDRARAQDAGKRYGEALHTMLLEGPEAFDAKYADEPEQPDLPKTKEEIGAALRGVGIVPPKDSAKRAEFVAHARIAGLTLAEDWLEQRATLLMGRCAISPKWRTAITLTRAIMEHHSGAQRYLTKGRAEVSVFWTDETGVRLKARFDYLHPIPLVDLKTYAMREGSEPIAAFCFAAERYAYDMQAAHYIEARTVALPALVAAGKVYDCGGPDGAMVDLEEADMEFMERVAAHPSPRWIWLTVMTGGVPEIDTVELPMDLLQFSAARAQIEEARRTYRQFRARFGDTDDELWLSDRGLIRLTDASFGMRAVNRGSATWERGE